jgi:hypothetical protein
MGDQLGAAASIVLGVPLDSLHWGQAFGFMEVISYLAFILQLTITGPLRIVRN